MLLPAISFLFLVGSCAFFVVVGVFALTYFQTYSQSERNSIMNGSYLLAFVAGAIPGAITTVNIFAWVGVHFVSGRMADQYLNKYVIGIAFISAAVLGGILTGLIVVWATTKVVLRNKSV